MCYKGRQGNLWGDDGNVLYLDCDVSYTTVYIQSCTLKKVNFTVCELQLNKKKNSMDLKTKKARLGKTWEASLWGS